MMGVKVRACAPLVDVSPDDLVPADHVYRHPELALDLGAACRRGRLNHVSGETSMPDAANHVELIGASV